ncbi:hypothetical protein [Streptomyces sp. NPDC005281]|uniref:hypothetical protein n=1 Tax=Streptomyces sp. NPDC005281 TaxID=3155712 RepID=UPI0033A985F0
MVPHGYREVGDYVSWSGGDTPGPSFSAVVAAPAHLVAKLEKEQAAQPSHHPPRFTAGGPVTGGAGDLEAAGELLRRAFPLLPGDGDDEMPVPAAAVAEQRRARHGARGLRLVGEEERLYRVADSLSSGHGCWVPDEPGELKLLEKLVSWLSWSTLRIDVLCGPTGRAGQWASVFGTLDSVTEPGIGFSPGGRHRALHIPWHRIVALSGAPNWDRGHGTPAFWQPYEPITVPSPPPAGTAKARIVSLSTVPEPKDAG